MKLFLSTVCALLLLGCSNDSTPAQSPAPEAAPVTATIPPVEQTAPAPAPVTSVPEAATPSKPSVAAASVEGGTLFGQKCASCHGAKGEKSALNKSQIIAQLSESQVKEALKGYQSGSYGKEMKALMQGQAKALDDAQIDALAKYISAL